VIAASVPAQASTRTTSQLIEMLVAALDNESRLMGALRDVIRRQREAVAHDNVDDLETANGAAHRVLTTLSEARLHRRTLNERLGESGELRLGAIPEWFGGVVPAALEAAVTQLADAARQLDIELSINQQVFHAAAASADREVRLLLGVDAPAPAAYGGAGESRLGRSVLVDRRG
jgi:hypothetical protein